MLIYSLSGSTCTNSSDARNRVASTISMPINNIGTSSDVDIVIMSIIPSSRCLNIYRWYCYNTSIDIFNIKINFMFIDVASAILLGQYHSDASNCVSFSTCITDVCLFCCIIM